MNTTAKPALFAIGDRVQHKRQLWGAVVDSHYVHTNGSRGYTVRKDDGRAVFAWQVDLRKAETATVEQSTALPAGNAQ